MGSGGARNCRGSTFTTRTDPSKIDANITLEGFSFECGTTLIFYSNKSHTFGSSHITITKPYCLVPSVSPSILSTSKSNLAAAICEECLLKKLPSAQPALSDTTLDRASESLLSASYQSYIYPSLISVICLKRQKTDHIFRVRLASETRGARGLNLGANRR